MISRLTGTIIHADLTYLVLDVGGVGYKLYTTAGILEKDMGTKVSFWTYLAVRETALDLYGFATKEELDLFELLITVSGIGPKTALGIMNMANVATLRRAATTDDPGYLTKTSGISKKTAEKIVLELKDKFSGFETDGHTSASLGESDALDALKALGYPEKDVRDVLKKVPQEITDTVERVKKALKLLGSK